MWRIIQRKDGFHKGGNTMEVGDKITQKVEVGKERKVVKTGTVVYIHPLWRFYTLEFALEHGTVRESYIFDHKEMVSVKPSRCFN